MIHILVLSVALIAEAPFEVRTTDGQALTGALVELTPSHVALDTSGGRVKVPFEDVAGVAPPHQPAAPTPAPTVWIDLVDGSLVRALSYAVDKGKARFEVSGGAVVEISTKAIAHVRFKKQEAEIAAQWAEILKRDRADDLIVIHQKSGLDFQAGIIEDVNDSTVAFKLDDETLAVKRTRVEGLAYFHTAGRELAATFCRVVDAAGSHFETRTVEIDGDRLRLATPAGLKLELALDQIAAVEGKVEYLSDLSPESAVWTPFFGLAGEPASLAEFHRPRMNEAIEGGALRLAGKEYAKGIAMRSRTELVYRLPQGQYRRLTALAGIDDRARPEGDVRLVITGDGRTLFEASVSGHEDPLPLDVDVKGISRVKILVDFGGGQEVSDHLDLCEARILK
jgi:hypothetical protein